MKVRNALALALSVLVHGSSAAAVSKTSFGPQNCVSLSLSSAGSCVISTDCGAADLSKTEFGFDCSGKDGIVRHSFGEGGFDSNEEFDTDVKCDKCEIMSAEETVAPAPKAKEEAPAAPAEEEAAAPKPVKATVPEVPAQAHVALKAKHSAKAGAKAKIWPFTDSNVPAPVEAEPEVVKYGPDGCVSTWRSAEGHCIIQTNCKDTDVSKYDFGLVCVDKVGNPVRHLFGKDSFDEEETFDTLIKCDKCLGLEDIPDGVALNGEVVTMAKDIENLKDVMKNISINVNMLNNEVFPAAPAPAPAKKAEAPAPAKKEEAKKEEKKEEAAAFFLTPGQTAQVAAQLSHNTHNLRHSHRHSQDDYDEDDSDDRGSDVQEAVMRDDEDSEEGEDED